MGHGEVDGVEVPKTNKGEKLSTTVDLYIGLFFDGTNNNKYQVMLGKMFRRKEIFEKAKKRLNDRLKEKVNGAFFYQDFNKFKDVHSTRKINDVLNLPNISKREIWEENGVNSGILTEGELNFIYGVNGKRIRTVNDVLNLSMEWVDNTFHGIFTKSELEFLYFGYRNIDANDNSDDHYDAFVERKSYATLGMNDSNQLSSKPDDAETRETLQKTAGNMVLLKESDSEKDIKRLKKYKGAPAQNSTYTNVAILESLYKCESIDKGNVTEKHISIYIEGSGTDMQFDVDANYSHIVGQGIIGLGKGTGSSGAVAKVRKATIMVERIMQQHGPKNGETRTVNMHFDVCGFSRGATSARMFCYVLSPDPSDDKKTYRGKGSIVNEKKDLKLFTGKGEEFLKKYNYLEKKEIRNLLIADTVASIGVLYHEGVSGFFANMFTRGVINFIGSKGQDIELSNNYYQSQVDKGTEDIDMYGKRPYHYQNVKDYGLWATKLAKHVIHICALDEVRQNFALTDIQSSIDEGTGTEIFIPGCHTDIGGGAAIGMEEAKIPNTGLVRYLSSYHVHSKSELEDSGGESFVRRLNVDTLKKIGWLDDDSMLTTDDDKTFTGRSKLKEDNTYYSENENRIVPNIIMYRHVTPGYSNVALNCFKDMADGCVFKEVPHAYAVPRDLQDLYNSIINLKASNRYFVYPNTAEQYYNLRRKYLHFSYNEQILSFADNILVNGPEFTDITVENQKVKVNSRIVYTGVFRENDDFLKKRRHMFDYE